MTTITQKTKRETTERLVEIFFRASKIGFPLLALSVIVAFVVPVCVRDLPAKVLTAKLTFTALGLLLGLLQLFLGVLLALIGVTIEYDIDAAVGPAKMKLASASPGILLIIAGNVLFGFALMREFEVSEMRATQPQPRGTIGQPEDHDPLSGIKGPE